MEYLITSGFTFRKMRSRYFPYIMVKHLVYCNVSVVCGLHSYAPDHRYYRRCGTFCEEDIFTILRVHLKFGKINLEKF